MNPNIVTTLAGILMTPVLALSSAVSGAAMTAPTSAAMPMTFGCISLSHNLMYGSRDYQTSGDVSTLQGFLVTQGDLYVNPTGYFGPMTVRAVQRFQSSQGIFTTGYVGAFTRAAISRASCGGNPPPSQALYIQSLMPSITTVGSSVTIYGGGFTQDNTITLGTGAIVHVASYDGTTLTFTVPSALSPACYFSTPPCLIASRQTTPGVYDLTVTNGNGTSNSVSLTINDEQQQASNVRIYSIAPTYGPVGTVVSITGSGFASSNTIRFGNGAIYNVPIASSRAIACTTDPNCHGGINQTLVFTVPNALGPYCVAAMACPAYAQAVTPGTYTVSVINHNGSSDPVPFNVTVVAGAADPQSSI